MPDQPKKPRVYGTPTGAEEPSKATDRPKPSKASDESVHQAVKAANQAKSDSWVSGREAPAPKSDAEASPSLPKRDIVDTLRKRGQDIDQATKDAGG